MKKLIFIVLAFLLALPLAAFANEITFTAVANVQFTLKDLKVEFTRETGTCLYAKEFNGYGSIAALFIKYHHMIKRRERLFRAMDISSNSGYEPLCCRLYRDCFVYRSQ
ncbi:MAG: hypothetical protein KGJ87_01755 [Planctomycetota bacterium]|nr:hypothetical protein [Planctomycetota bacterium]MDE1889812.1 hypothetical protein [Planctomycetota bacterium]MDE2215881.1 hypothetical protein [Planctomycetota bacterium]